MTPPLRKTTTNRTSVTVSISCTVLGQALCATLAVMHQLWSTPGFPVSSSLWPHSLLLWQGSGHRSLAGDLTSQTVVLLGVSSLPDFPVSFLSPCLLS